MNILNFIQRNGILIAVPLFLLSAILLPFSIRGLVGLGERSRLATLPLQEAQTLQLFSAGRVVLSLEGPRLSKRFSELAFELISPETGPLPSKEVWFPIRASGMATVRLELVSFQIPVPGSYTLRIRNLGVPREGDLGHRILLSKPHFPELMGYVLGMVLSGSALIGSIVLFLLRVLSKGGDL